MLLNQQRGLWGYLFGVAHMDGVGGFEAPFAPSVMGTASKSQGSGCGGYTPGSSLKLLQDFPGSCFQTCHSPAFIQCRMMQSQCKQPSCTFFSYWESVFWCNLASLCWLGWMQDSFTLIRLSGCVCPALSTVGCDICLESTGSNLIHVFLLWLTIECHLLLSVPTRPRYICTSKIPPSVLLCFPIDSWWCVF